MAAAARERVFTHFQRKEIARLTAELYSQAIENHKTRVDSKLYRHDETRLYEDIDEFVQAWDEGLYDMLFLEPAFRVVHYFRAFKARPKLFFARAMLVLIKKVAGKRAKNLTIVKRLESQVQAKSEVAVKQKGARQSELLKK